MSEMVERGVIATEQCLREHGGYHISKDMRRWLVLAVIGSMRKPTDAMIAVMAGYDWSPAFDRIPKSRPFEDDARDCWAEMIDEALK